MGLMSNQMSDEITNLADSLHFPEVHYHVANLDHLLLGLIIPFLL